MGKALLIVIIQKSVNTDMSMLTEILVLDKLKLNSIIMNTLIMSIVNVVASDKSMKKIMSFGLPKKNKHKK